jgi:hypothetical protein
MIVQVGRLRSTFDPQTMARLAAEATQAFSAQVKMEGEGEKGGGDKRRMLFLSFRLHKEKSR